MHRNITYVIFLFFFSLSTNSHAVSNNQRLLDAIRNNQLEFFERQLAAGLDPNQRVLGHALLVHAVNARRIDIIKRLLGQGARYQDYIFGETLKGNSHAVNSLVAAGANLHTIKNKQGETLLMLAAREGHEEIVKTLVLQGTDVNAKSNKGHNAMSYSSRYGHLAVVQYLLNHGAEVNITNNNGWTPLLKAARGGHLAVVDYLLAHDADIRSRNSGGQDALALARRYKHNKVVSYLKKYK